MLHDAWVVVSSPSVVVAAVVVVVVVVELIVDKVVKISLIVVAVKQVDWN